MLDSAIVVSCVCLEALVYRGFCHSSSVTSSSPFVCGPSKVNMCLYWTERQALVFISVCVSHRKRCQLAVGRLLVVDIETVSLLFFTQKLFRMTSVTSQRNREISWMNCGFLVRKKEKQEENKKERDSERRERKKVVQRGRGFGGWKRAVVSHGPDCWRDSSSLFFFFSRCQLWRARTTANDIHGADDYVSWWIPLVVVWD